MFGNTSLASSFASFHVPQKIFGRPLCKTIRPVLPDRCPVLSCLSVLSVMLMYCGQTVGMIKMKLGMRVDLGPGHIVLDGDPAGPPQRGGRASPSVFGQYILWLNG